MRIALNGSTEGIGQAVANRLRLDHEVFAYNRSTGYELPARMNSLIDAVSDKDVFVNVAYPLTDSFDPTQFLVLKSLTERWKFQAKMIVQIGSVCSEQLSPVYDGMWDYSAMKSMTDRFCEAINNSPRRS